MNLWIRLLKVLLFSRFRSKVEPLEISEIDFRVWPNDLDIFRHMNNGRYLTLMDLGRVDLMVRTGLLEKLNSKGYYPVVAEEMIRFRKSLSLFRRFTLRSQVLAWDDKFFYMKQEFVDRGDLVAVGFIKARFLKKSGGKVSPLEVLGLIGLENLAMPDAGLIQRFSWPS